MFLCQAPSSSGLGLRPFTPATRVRVPSGSFFRAARFDAPAWASPRSALLRERSDPPGGSTEFRPDFSD